MLYVVSGCVCVVTTQTFYTILAFNYENVQRSGKSRNVIIFYNKKTLANVVEKVCRFLFKISIFISKKSLQIYFFAY